MISRSGLYFIAAALTLILSYSQIFSSSGLTFTNGMEKKTKSAALTLEGKVADAATTQIIADAQISIPALGISTLSDEEGQFELKNLPSGTHTVEVEAEGYKLWKKKMTLEEDTELTMKLERKAQNIRVKMTGAPSL